jgi:hypothetical protein
MLLLVGSQECFKGAGILFLIGIRYALMQIDLIFGIFGFVKLAIFG